MSVRARFVLIEKLGFGPCNLGVGCNETGVCYAAAHQDEAQCGSKEGVKFTLQDESGDRRSFKHPDFDEFCRIAVPLVGLGYAVTDTDQLIGHWFDFPYLEKPLDKHEIVF